MSLQAFLHKFNSADGKYAYTIDPLKYFNTRIAFAHGDTGSGSSTLQSAVSNVLNNLTGGLTGKFLNSSKGNMKTTGYPNIPSLATASLLEDTVGNTLDITYFTREGTLPELQFHQILKLKQLLELLLHIRWLFSQILKNFRLES